MKLAATFAILATLTVTVITGVALAIRDRRAGKDGSPAELAELPAIDTRRQQLIGVRTARVVRGSLNPVIRTPGVVQYDQTRLTDVNLKLDGWISNLRVTHVGQRVAKGDALFSLYSPDLVAAQNDYIVALRNRDQVTSAQAADAREYGGRLVEAPMTRLTRWDVPDDQLQLIATERKVQQSVVFRSPVSGLVIEKTVINGMHVQAGQTLYRLADLSVVWVEADFRDSDLSDLREGAGAEVMTDAWPGQRLSGRITRIYPFMSEASRTVKARIELPNPRGRLKPGMFASVEVKVTPRAGLIVPEDAVLDSGARQTVFVARGDGHFEPRTVTVGGRTGGKALVTAGLKENEAVAERAAFFLDSESQMRTALQGYQPMTSAPPASGQKPAVTITVETSPNPPRTGENVVEVRVREGDVPLSTDAEVKVVLSMPAMPSMNMPAMRADARLNRVAPGVFTGPVFISMAGRWDLTASVLRQGQTVATRQTSVMAR